MDGDGSLEWATIDRERSFSCEAFDVFTESVRLPDGRSTRFDYVAEAPSAVVLAFADDRDVVVLDEYRHAVGRVVTGLPGGSIEGDERPRETASRELREETGFRAQTIEPLFRAHPANGVLDSTRHFFKAEGCERLDGGEQDSDESIRVRTMPFEELLSTVTRGEVIDERTVAAVLFHHATSGG